MNFLKILANKFSIKFNFKEFIIVFFTIFFLFASDRFTKISAIKNLSNVNNIYINDYLNLNLNFNTGIGFGLFSLESGAGYHLISFLIFLVLIYLFYLVLNSNFLDRVLFSMILGGATGNFYDRIIYFSVPDFIDVHYMDFHWFTFNLADIFISLGIITLLFREMFLKK